jgi:hypothetical protein
VLVVSDLTKITQKQIEVLKRVLGHDTLKHEKSHSARALLRAQPRCEFLHIKIISDYFYMKKKYEIEFDMIAPYCQVIMISNHPPSHFV